jgi:hypothetical protein
MPFTFCSDAAPLTELNSQRTNHFRKISVLTHTWSPLFAKHSIRFGKEVEIAAIHPDFGAAKPLSLMEYAGRFLISLTSFSLPV